MLLVFFCLFLFLFFVHELPSFFSTTLIRCRHIVWDWTANYLDLPTVRRSSYIVLGVAGALTALALVV